MKFIVIINVKMPTIVDILTFMSMINTTSERPKAICWKFSFYEQLKFCTQLSMSFFINSGQAWSGSKLFAKALADKELKLRKVKL